MNAPELYTLPAIDFVGGATQDLLFHVFFHNIKNPFDLSRCTANFAVINYVNRSGDPLISKQMTISRGDVDAEGNVISNILRVTLTATDTVNMTGKFIYQISVKDNTGKAEIPSQGVFYIANNINKSYIRG